MEIDTTGGRRGPRPLPLGTSPLCSSRNHSQTRAAATQEPEEEVPVPEQDSPVQRLLDAMETPPQVTSRSSPTAVLSTVSLEDVAEAIMNTPPPPPGWELVVFPVSVSRTGAVG
eukprot:8355411-Pyramimonas_sp.AAC.1